MRKEYVIAIILLLLSVGMLVVREIWTFSRNISIVLSTVQLILSVCIFLCIVSTRRKD